MSKFYIFPEHQAFSNFSVCNKYTLKIKVCLIKYFKDKGLHLKFKVRLHYNCISNTIKSNVK